MEKIILASQSPRRKQLLEWAEVPFTIQVLPTAEDFPPGMDPVDVPVHIARNKCLAVQALQKEKVLVLAADTVVVLGSQIIGKPADLAEAKVFLGQLSGKKHRVITGVVMRKGDQEIAFADVTEVQFHALTPEQIGFYVDKYQPLDKAGAYAIQEWIGVVGIQSVNGDFYNVMGLPVSRVVQALSQFK